MTTDDDNNDDSSVDDDSSNDASDYGSNGDVSGSNDKLDTLSTKTEDVGNAPWMSLVTMANKNVENRIDSDFVDSSPDKWTDLQFNYDLDAERVPDNNESADIFVCMAYTGRF